MESVTISLEKYENMSKGIDRKVKELHEFLKKYENVYDELHKKYLFKEKQLDELMKILVNNLGINIQFDLKGEPRILNNPMNFNYASK
jgi:hypothetical protein